MKRLMFQSVIGLFFGAFLMVLATCATFLTGVQETIDGGLFIKNALGYMFCGWFFAVTPLYFEIPSLHLIQQTILHFITVACLYFILSFGIGWVPFDVKSAASAAGLFLVAYTVIWIGFYVYFNKEAQQMNEELNRL